MKNLMKLLSLLLCLCVLASLFCLSVWADEEEGEDANREGSVIVSLGDSYASGEGIDSFYGWNQPMEDRCKDEDWLAHRSVYSWGGMLTVPGTEGTMADNKGTKWFFAASSGSETEQIKRTGSSVVDAKTGRKEGQQTKEYDRDGHAGSYNLPGQLDVFYNNPNLDRKKVDYVTLSIGGNDVGFEDIIKTAATGMGHKSGTYDGIDSRLTHFYDAGSTHDKLKEAYKRVAEAAPNATIIVTGYPPLLAGDGGDSYLFDSLEAEAINLGVHAFNNNIQALINECKREGMKIEFVSVEEEFEGHEAYSHDPWINPVIAGSGNQDLKENRWGLSNFKINNTTSPYSIHPNRKGAEAYARCVQKKIDELEAEKAQKRAGQVSDKRNVVLVLDTSGSMSGSPIQETRSSAKEFIDNILKEDASVGVVTFASNASLRSNFSRQADTLKGIVDGISASGNTNTESGIRLAAGMLRACKTGQRIIVLMSDGLANEGLTGAALEAYIESLKSSGIYVYTMGFFQGLYGSDLTEGQNLMEKAASPGYHYEVESTDHLNYIFNDIADQINGQNYSYFRIACPVDVEVTCNGETLSSSEGVNRTAFGTITYEAGEGNSTGSRDDRTKILRLREDGTEYQIDIRGNGTGTMNFTAGYMDGNGEYTDLREIKEIPITPETVIRANADRDDATTLEVDENGDGFADKTYSAGGPPSRWWIYVLAGILLAGAAAAALLLLRKKRAGVRAPATPGLPGMPGVVYPTVNPAAMPVTPQAPVSPQTPVQGPTCQNCGARQDPTARFCTVCGASLVQAPPPQVKYCTNCGAKAAADDTFCTNCGARL